MMVKEFAEGNLAFPFWMRNICRKGDLFEIVIYDHMLPEPQRRGIEKMLMEKFGI